LSDLVFLKIEYDKFIRTIVLAAIILYSLNENKISAQTIYGTTGLISIPTADMLGEGEISFGAGFIHKKDNLLYPDKYHQSVFYAALGYLPFLEVSLRVSRQINFNGAQALGDRMPCIKIRILEESETLPSIALGAHDFMWAVGDVESIHYNAAYFVCSKHILLSGSMIDVGLHAGYGTDWMKAANHTFVGIFGGISAFLHKTAGILLEYDAKQINSAIQLNIFNHFSITAIFFRFNSFSGIINYKFLLDK